LHSPPSIGSLTPPEDFGFKKKYKLSPLYKNVQDCNNIGRNHFCHYFLTALLDSLASLPKKTEKVYIKNVSRGERHLLAKRTFPTGLLAQHKKGLRTWLMQANHWQKYSVI
jgi:hypothetical protein